MTVDRNTLVLFDASCLIAGAGSPTGGAGFLLSLCRRRWLQGAVSQVVLLEAEHNIQAKMSETVYLRFQQLLQDTPFTLAAVPLISPDAAWVQSVNAKDIHVVSALLNVNAPYLLTLDQNLVAEVNDADIPAQALTPGEFIRTILPRHKDFPALR